MPENEPRTDDTDEGEMTGETVSADWTTIESPVVSIVNAVAAATERDPSVLSPLEDSLDTDALNEIMTSVSSSENGTDVASNSVVQLSFTYEGCLVVVENSGQVAVQRIAEST